MAIIEKSSTDKLKDAFKYAWYSYLIGSAVMTIVIYGRRYLRLQEAADAEKEIKNLVSKLDWPIPASRS